MNRTYLDKEKGQIVYSPSPEQTDLYLLEQTQEEIKKMSFSKLIEFIKEKTYSLTTKKGKLKHTNK